MQLKKFLFLAGALAAMTTAGAQTIPSQQQIDRIVDEAVEQAERSADRAVDRAMNMVRVFQDTVIVAAGRHRVQVVERNDDGSRTEVFYYNDRRSDDNNGSTHRRRRAFDHRMMIDLGWSIYDPRNIISGADGGDEFVPQNTSKSFGVAVYPWMGRLRLNHTGTLGITSGIGLDMANYHFEGNRTITSFEGIARPIHIPYPDPVKKSKLQTTYLNVPLILTTRIPLSHNHTINSIHLQAGVIGGLKLGSHTKIKYGHGDGRDKERGSFYLSPLRYQLTARAGYGPVVMFFNYQMTPMFKNGHGAELYPYTVGLSFTFGRN